MASLRGGIDLGGTKIEAIVVDGYNKVLGSARHPTPQEGGPEAVARQMAAAVSEAATKASVEPAALLGIGVGSPGAVDSATGVVTAARNLNDWEGSFPLGETLSTALGTRVVVGNDVAVGTEAEFTIGAAKQFTSLLGVFWGTGVGGGVILDKELWHGRGGAGEIGHVLYKPGGRRCGCGNRGCVEAYAGRASMESKARRLIKHHKKSDLLSIMEKKGRDRFTSSVWAHAVGHGDPVATKLIGEAVDALGAGIASAVNLLDVEAVVIGGGLGTRFGEEYVTRIEAAMGPHLFPGHRRPVVTLAGLGDLGGALGAALLVKRARAPRRAD
ncbi:ROK family protein [Conexibacter sp. DBS9H8]|uniref:ROK family protein n=1 Tax=Conexibacter sp. DBS9H8 TaxID=2937801 RepID=UPI00200EF7AB|nr:ROK family protein [Conexibacter sp. DBS9H8]